MGKSSDAMLLYRIAQYYYIEKMSQNEIALVENISRSQISRLLGKAEEMGIVKFTVSLPQEFDNLSLEASLQSALGLQDAVVAPVPDFSGTQEDTEAITEAIATAAASYLPGKLKGCMTVGLGWGKAMYTTSLKIAYRHRGEELTYVPLIGLSGNTEPHLQVNTIVDRMAEKYRARSYFVNTPAFREKMAPTTKNETVRQEKLREYWRKLDAAIVGLGAPPTDEMFVAELSPDYVEPLKNSGACGDILAQYFTEDGRVFDFGSAYSQVAYDIKYLPTLRTVVCIAGGREKVRGIIAAARLRYINNLVTDSATAKYILSIV